MRLLKWIVVAALLGYAMRPLLGPHQISGHSTYSDLVRAEALHAAVSHGDWTPRWLPDFYFGHGSPTFHFYAPGGYYLVELSRLLGASPLWALKIAFLLSWLLGAAATYRLAIDLGGRAGATLATLAYGLAPYLLIDVYMRNGIAEVAAFGLFPWVLWATWRTAKGPRLSSWLLAVAGTAALALTHNITSLLATPILLGLALTAGERLRGKGRALTAIGVGLAIAAFFWLPALLDQGQVSAGQSLTGGYFDYQRHFLDPVGMVTPAGGGPLVIGPRETVSIKFGALLVLGLLAALVALCLPRLRHRLKVSGVVAYFVGATLVCLWMATPLSAFLWGHLPLLRFVQFPWRFLLPATCLAAPLVGLLPRLAPRRARRLVRYALISLAVTVAAPYIFRVYLLFEPDPNGPRQHQGEPVRMPAAQMAGREPAADGLVAPHRLLTIETLRGRGVTGTVSNDFLPSAVERLPRGLPQPAEVVRGDGRLLAGGWGYPSVWAEVEARGETRVALGQFWFPGWRVWLDGKETPVVAEPGRGRLLVTVPAGRHRLEARFGANGSVRWGYAVSLLGVLALGCGVVGWRRIGGRTNPTDTLAAE